MSAFWSKETKLEEDIEAQLRGAAIMGREELIKKAQEEDKKAREEHQRHIERQDEDFIQSGVNPTQTPEEILRDPNIFRNMIKELGKKIAGEEAGRKVIFLVSCSRLVENMDSFSSNLLVNDLSGVGKDHVTRETLNIWPQDVFIHKYRISPTVLSYWHNHKFEPEWTWDDKLLYLEDASNAVLNHEVVKVYSSGKKGKINSTVVTRNQAPIELNVHGKAAVFVTSANAEPIPEITRRFPILNLDSSSEQTRRIMQFQARRKSGAFIEEVNPNFTSALGLLKSVKVFFPHAEGLSGALEDKNLLMRSNYPRFCDFVAFSAALHQFQRERDEKNFVLATKQDYCIAKDVIEALFTNRKTMPLTFNERRVLGILENLGKGEHVLRDILPKAGFITKRNLINNLYRLQEKTFISIDEKADALLNREVSHYSLIEPQTKFVMPSWEEITS